MSQQETNQTKALQSDGSSLSKERRLSTQEAVQIQMLSNEQTSSRPSSVPLLNLNALVQAPALPKLEFPVEFLERYYPCLYRTD